MKVEAFIKSKEAIERGLVAIIEDADGDKFYYVQNDYGCLCVQGGDINLDLERYLAKETHSRKIDELEEDFLASDTFIGTTTVTELLLEVSEAL